MEKLSITNKEREFNNDDCSYSDKNLDNTVYYSEEECESEGSNHYYKNLQNIEPMKESKNKEFIKSSMKSAEKRGKIKNKHTTDLCIEIKKTRKNNFDFLNNKRELTFKMVKKANSNDQPDVNKTVSKKIIKSKKEKELSLSNNHLKLVEGTVIRKSLRVSLKKIIFFIRFKIKKITLKFLLELLTKKTLKCLKKKMSQLISIV